MLRDIRTDDLRLPAIQPLKIGTYIRWSQQRLCLYYLPGICNPGKHDRAVIAAAVCRTG